MIRSFLELFAREFHRFAKRNDARNVLSSGASLTLLLLAIDLDAPRDPAGRVPRQVLAAAAQRERRRQLVQVMGDGL